LFISSTSKKKQDRKERKDRKLRKDRKERYLARHKNDNYNNPLYPSFYSNNLLWNKPTITESVRDTNRRFKNINIKLR
jgi:hypothetical protein